MTAALAPDPRAQTMAPTGHAMFTIWLPCIDHEQPIASGSVVMSQRSAGPSLVIVVEPLPRERFADRAERAERELRAGSATNLRDNGGFRAVAVWDPRQRVVRADDLAALGLLRRWIGPDSMRQLELRRQLRASRHHTGAHTTVTALLPPRRGEPCR